MTPEDLTKMERVVQVKYLVQRRELTKLLARENAVRDQLLKLDQNVRTSEYDAQDTMRAIGADVIWKSWVGRKKTQLNMQLAQILAQKEHHMQQVRKSYGKVLVVDDLSRRGSLEIRRKRVDAQLQNAIEMAIYHKQ